MTLLRTRTWILASALAVGCPMLARAQAQRMPREGGLSVWGTGGFVSPSEGAFSSAFGVSGGIDYFFTRALSIGVAAGGWRTSTDLGSHANELYFDAVGTYNWEMGQFHPFVQGGLGLYREDFPARSASTKFGGFAGGGLDVFVSRTWALEGAARYHAAESTSGLEGNFFEALAGVKVYF